MFSILFSTAYPFNKYDFNTFDAHILKWVPVFDFTLYPTEIITSRLYNFVLYFLPSPAVRKESLLTENPSSSPSVLWLYDSTDFVIN